MNKKIYETYAKLAVEVGINLQAGQDVEITASTKCVEFVKELVTACYDSKARHVHVNWTCDEITKLCMIREDRDSLSEVRKWEEEKARHNAEALPCKIFVDDEDPNAFAGVDIEKMSSVMNARKKIIKKYRDMEEGKNQWLIVAVPSAGWAKAVFPEDDTDTAIAKLWDAIIASMRLDTPDPVDAWKRHCRGLLDKCEKLNSLKLDYLRYTSANGTDLKLKLHPRHLWCGGSEVNLKGVEFVANMPTEEIYSMPLRDGVDGVVVSTKPLSLHGQLVENFKVTFEAGKAVKVEAERGADVLETMLNMDESSRYLGEVALVPYDSPINKTGILFSNTLFDENACCHFAFGSAYKNTMRGYETMSDEDFKAENFNDSVNHVDFMIGSDDLDIKGYDTYGNEYTVFENGVWAI